MKQATIRMTFRSLRLVSMILATPMLAWTQDASVRQVLTLNVVELSKIDLNAKTLTITIDRIKDETFGPAPVTNSTTKLVWTCNGENRKITIASSNVSSRFGLTAEAVNLNPGSGMAVGKVVLSDNVPQDFVVGVSRSFGNCIVRFSASASARQGMGTETFFVTYTITSS